MRRYKFNLVVARANKEEQGGILYSEKVRDAEVKDIPGGELEIDFNRNANSFETAVMSAIDDIEAKMLGVVVVRVNAVSQYRKEVANVNNFLQCVAWLKEAEDIDSPASRKAYSWAKARLIEGFTNSSVQLY